MNEYTNPDTSREQSQDDGPLGSRWFRAILSSLGDGVIATNSHGQVTFLNLAGQALTGWTLDDAQGKPLDEVLTFISEEPRRPLKNPIAQVLHGKSAVDLPHRTLLSHRDGRDIPMTGSAAPIRNGADETMGVVLVFRDAAKVRQAEIAVREAKEYTENIVDTVRHPLLVLDGNLRVQTANRSFYRAFHVTPETTEQQSIFDLGNGQWNIPKLRELLTDILPQNTSFDDFEVEQDFPSIGHRFMRLNARRMYRPGNHSELILLAIEDVTEQRRAEEQRREIETRFTSLVKNIKDHSIFTLDPAGHITSWNREAERILGFSEQEALGRHFSLIFTPEDIIQGVPQEELALAQKFGRAEDERWHKRKCGELFWALGIVTPTIDATGKHTGFSKILRDMTPQKRAEEMLQERMQRLAEAEERMRSIVDHVIDGIITIDEQATIDSFNPAAERLFGYQASEVIGQNVKILMPEPYRSQHDGYLASYLTSGQAKIIGTGREVVGKRKDGSTFPMDLAVSEFHLKGERYFTGIVRDISERKQAENNLRQLAADLSEADRRKTAFLATLGHELRNPLAPIRTGLELLKFVADDPAQREETRCIMERQAQQMVRLIDDLLDVSRITQDKLALRTCRIVLAEVIQNAVEASQPFVYEAGHELKVTLPRQAISLEADPNRLAQVVSNLLNNSAKYTPQGGHIELSAEQVDGEVIITVQDNGIGIPAEMQDRIFEMFNQIDRPLEQGHKGLGIGLTLVKRLVEMHGGTIKVHSEGANKGSEFRVRLPILTESSFHEPKAIHKDLAVSTTRHRVLVVDDNTAAANMLSRVVEMMGNEVRTAYDGQQAIEVAAEFAPDVVLMDIGMPKMNGYEAARHIRQQSWGEKLMLVALTGWGQEDDKRQTKEAGFDYHLVKPAESTALQKLLAIAKDKRPGEYL